MLADASLPPQSIPYHFVKGTLSIAQVFKESVSYLLGNSTTSFGLIFGLSYVFTKSLWTAIFTHVTSNILLHALAGLDGRNQAMFVPIFGKPWPKGYDLGLWVILLDAAIVSCLLRGHDIDRSGHATHARPGPRYNKHPDKDRDGWGRVVRSLRRRTAVAAQREENEAWRFIYLNINLICCNGELRLLPGKSLHPPTSGKAVLQDQ
jgi:hypothetical protein